MVHFKQTSAILGPENWAYINLHDPIFNAQIPVHQLWFHVKEIYFVKFEDPYSSKVP
jgi:hypothetical protein